jgi:uncharacterized membrane protein YfcA
MNLLDQTTLFLISLVANIFSAFSGGGAGLIQLPALIFLGLPFVVALATHKVASVALGIGATLRHLREGGLEKSLALFILATGLPGVVLGAQLIINIPGRAAEIALGILTAGLGLYSWLNPGLGQTNEVRHRDVTGFRVGGAGLFLIGVLNGSLTSGTGLFVTLWLVRWFGFDYRRAVAYTLILVGIFWNGTGAVTLGCYFGAHLAIKKGNRWIKRAFEVITLVIGVKLIAG